MTTTTTSFFFAILSSSSISRRGESFSVTATAALNPQIIEYLTLLLCCCAMVGREDEIEVNEQKRRIYNGYNGKTNFMPCTVGRAILAHKAFSKIITLF